MTFYFGVDYYPEHWPRERWETYASQMRGAHFNVVRLAEFAWVLMEPREGHFDFSWLDDALDILHKQQLHVILGTPTAAMPAWVKHKYPETLASLDGHHRDAWGVRKNNCFSSGTYRLLSERITRAMAERYANHPALLGWQTDNEFDGPTCRCLTCRREFYVFLQDRYTDIGALNEAWGTRFWGHCYSAWEEIPVPTNFEHDNPSLCLDWKRFQTHLQVRFQHDQVRILRQVCPQHLITHNYMGFGNISDCYELSRDIDIAGLDNYPNYAGNDEPIPYGVSAACDMTRGLKGRNFWIIETTAGPTGWGVFGRSPRLGELRKTFFQHVAHGADAQIFFRWRTCTVGREQYWHGLLGHDGRLGRRYREAAQIGEEIESLAPHLEGTTLRPQVALLYDYDSRWATEIQPSFAENNYVAHLRRYYDALVRAGVNVDIVSPALDLSAYRAVLAPQLHVLPEDTAKRLSAFVAGGGVLVADTRTGVKTESNRCYELPLPGLLSETLGIDIGEYEAPLEECGLRGEGSLSGSFTAHQYTDWITPTGATVLARYESWHARDYAAVTRHVFGTGTAYYVGAVVKETEFYDALIRDVLSSAAISAPMTPPAGCEVSLRVGRDHRLLFVLNHTEEPQWVEVAPGWTDLLTGRTTDGRLLLERYGVAVLRASGSE